VADKVIIDRRLCLTEDKSRVVDETSPDARWLWAIPGHVVDRAEAEQLGALKPVAQPEVVAPEPAADEPPKRRRGRPPGTKRAVPDEDKADLPDEDKSGLSYPSQSRRN
jgi:hypothetical protein